MSPVRKPEARPAGQLPLPEVRQDVDLTIDVRERLPARVTRVNDEEIVLVVLINARDVLRPGEVKRMTIEFAGARGLITIEGDGAVLDYDVVRLRLDGDVRIIQRRDFVRVGCCRPLALARCDEAGAPGRWVDTLTVNVSGNGILAGGLDALMIDDEIAFRLHLTDEDPPVEGRGRVARTSDDGQRGIAIEQLPDEGRRRLVAFIFERERIARRVTRDGEL
ncbi:MAG TPA: PilZ domain-containing protein [Conexibacter sp.]|jgi:hypothetical protein